MTSPDPCTDAYCYFHYRGDLAPIAALLAPYKKDASDVRRGRASVSLHLRSTSGQLYASNR